MTGKRFSFITLLAFITIAAALFLCSCGAGKYTEPAYHAYDDAMEYGAVMEEALDGEWDYDYDEYGEEYESDIAADMAGGSATPQARNRYIIRNGSIELSVKNTKEALQQIRKLTADAEGFVSNSYIYEVRENQYNGQMTLRIPEARFEAVMEQLEEIGKAAHTETGADDITMQYVDLESRLKNQKAQEERLIEILDMADTVEDVLEIEKELNRVRGEIEAMTAQLNYLKDQVSYATINVTVREEKVPTDVVKTGAFDDFAFRVREAFIGSINALLGAVSFVIIALIALLPAAIVIVAIILLVRWLVRKRRKNKKAAPGEQIEAKEEQEEVKEGPEEAKDEDK